METYFWIEDRKNKSGYQFWSVFLSELFPEIKLESKNNSTELIKAVKKINDQNKYIIALDYSFDNDNAIRETK